MRYFIGDGVKKNRDVAVLLFHKAATHGHAKAQYELGECYVNGYCENCRNFSLARAQNIKYN